MALQTLDGGIAWPPHPPGVGSALPSTGSLLLDAVGESAALVYPSPVALAIHTIHVRTGVVTTGDTVDVRVETVDSAANGDPTGTLATANANGALVIAGSDDNVWKSVVLTADHTPAVGEMIALRVTNGSVPGNLNIGTFGGQFYIHFPYGDLFTAAWVKQAAALPFILPQYVDGSFHPIPGITGVGQITATTFNSGSATNRRGNIFQVPVPCRVARWWAWIDADGPFTVTLYDSDGTSVLATSPTMSNFQRFSVAPGLMWGMFSAPATLVANTSYRVEVVPTSGTGVTTYEFNVASAAMLDMFTGGQTMHQSVYTSSAWVETTTARAYLGVYLDAFSDGVGAGGGLLVHGGMDGGMRG